MCESVLDKKFFLVFGMHRSGTSALAGSLQEAGVFFVDDPGVVPDNKKGSYENPEVWKAHDKLLENKKGFWYAPPLQTEITPEFLKWQEEYVFNLTNCHRLCGMKDPRSILFAESWVDIIVGSTHQLQVVGIFRHPFEVIDSIKKRNPTIKEDQLIQLWTFYNKHLLYWSYRLNFPLLDFNDYRFGLSLEHLCGDFGLKTDLSFYEFDLQNHFYGGTTGFSDEVKDIYERLVERAWQ